MKILLIQLKQIGDVLLTTSLLKNIKENFPDSKVDILVYDYCSGVVKNNPFVDNIIEISKEERKNALKFYMKIYKLRDEKYDYSIDLLSDVRSALITFFIGAKNKVVSKKNKIRNKLFYNIRLENRCSNVVEYRNHLLKALSRDIKLNNEVKIYLKNSEVELLKERMKKNGVNHYKCVVALGINSRREYKKWDLDYFVEVIDWLIEKYDMQIILYNNKEEKQYAEIAKSKIKNKKNVFTDIYTENIRELAALLKNCDMFIGNEGGPRHIAESVGVPTLIMVNSKHNKEEWVFNVEKWQEKNKIVQIYDYLNLDEKEIVKYKKQISVNSNSEKEEFKKLKPEFVKEKIVEMIEELKEKGCFREEIEWKR